MITLVAATILAASLAGLPPATVTPPLGADTLPAGTRLEFHLVEPLSSNGSKTGQAFTFVLTSPIVVNGQVVVADGSVGNGTLILAGHAGTSGHEGDLTLRLDTLPAVDGSQVSFCDQRLHINGRNKKVMSAALGLIPYAGFGARFIRGADVSLDTATPIETVLTHPTESPADACPVIAGAPPIATPAPSDAAPSTPSESAPLEPAGSSQQGAVSAR